VAAGEEASALLERLARSRVEVILIEGDGSVHDPGLLLAPA
jgi:hypothetical protein